MGGGGWGADYARVLRVCSVWFGFVVCTFNVCLFPHFVVEKNDRWPPLPPPPSSLDPRNPRGRLQADKGDYRGGDDVYRGPVYHRSTPRSVLGSSRCGFNRCVGHAKRAASAAATTWGSSGRLLQRRDPSLTIPSVTGEPKRFPRKTAMDYGVMQSMPTSACRLLLIYCKHMVLQG